MALNLDKKMLSGFSREVQSYLPEIRGGIESFRRNPTRPGTLTDTLRYIHTIKGASAMLGLSALSQAAASIESTLEEVVAGQLLVVASQVEWLSLTVDHIEQYMEGLLAGSTPEPTIITEVDQLLEEFKSQPAADNARTEMVSTAEVSTPATTIMVDEEEAPPLLMDVAQALSFLDAADDAAADTIAVSSTPPPPPEEEDAPALLMDVALALAFDTDDDEVADEPAEATAAVPPTIAASLEPTAVVSMPVETDQALPSDAGNATEAMAINGSHDSVELLLDFPIDGLTDAEAFVESPTPDSTPATPVADTVLASQDATLGFTAAQVPAEEAAAAASDDTSVAPAFLVESAFTEEAMPEFFDTSELPEATSPALADAALASTDDFAADLLVDTADLDVAASASTEEQLPPTAAARDDATAESWTDTDATSEPLPPTPGALDSLIAAIDAEIQQSYTPGAKSIVRQRVVDGDSTLERYLLVTMQGRLYAIAVPHVLEVGRLPAITPVPNVPTWLRGVINLRGEILSVIDVRTFLGFEDGHYTESNRMLVVKALGDDMTTSLVVDQIKGFVQLPKASIQTPPLSLEDKVAPYLTGISEYAEQTLAVLDLERFLCAPEVRQFE